MSRFYYSKRIQSNSAKEKTCKIKLGRNKAPVLFKSSFPEEKHRTVLLPPAKKLWQHMQSVVKKKSSLATQSSTFLLKISLGHALPAYTKFPDFQKESTHSAVYNLDPGRHS